MIKAKGLSMHYGPVRALNDVSFEVNRGEIVGLLGPNGAGKSTSMKILTTYLHPSAGTAEINGIDVLKDPLKVRRVIGYLPEVLPLYMDMEVRSYLNFVGKARGLSGRKLSERVNVVVEATGLRPMFRKVVRELSKGFKQRTALAQALIHNPDVVILDEPTSGLDPHQIVEIRHLIGELAKEKTVILSTHILQEVETTADRIVIINQGRIVGNGTVDELRNRAKDGERTLVSLVAEKKEAERALSGIQGVKHVEVFGENGEATSFLLHSNTNTHVWREVNELTRAKNWPLQQLTEKPLSLEETFLRLTEKAGQNGG
ncbi:MAG: ATP-binding cassette domain-containing protein [Candidatus Hydrogenedentes bacterium]|nr:ATP-binding cassette domain-containing protein [Candidatus Hydrogenedentota bacterium]